MERIVISEGDKVSETIPHWLTKQASLHPHKIALEWPDGTTLTFRQLADKSKSFAKKLANYPLEKGTRIAILANNCLDVIVAIHAISYVKAVAVLLNTKLTKRELSFQLERSGASLLLTTEELLQTKELAFSEQVTFSDVARLEPCDIALADNIHLAEPFTMMYTSGTTGEPKGVVHTYGNHWYSAVGSVFNLGLHDDDKWLLTLPMYHVGGFSILVRSVMYGMTVFVMNQYDKKTLLHALCACGVTIASLVTVMLQDVANDLKGKQLPNNVRTILLGGGSVPEHLLTEVERYNIPLFQT